MSQPSQLQPQMTESTVALIRALVLLFGLDTVVDAATAAARDADGLDEHTEASPSGLGEWSGTTPQ